MTLNDLLVAKGIDPKQVLVFRHRPRESKLNRILPWLALERPDLFNAYQQTQGENVENAMKKAKYVAAFIARGPRKAIFVGLYEIKSHRPLTHAEFESHPTTVELTSLGLSSSSPTSVRQTVLWFDLVLTDFYTAWKGRLIVEWPPPERSWWRRAHRNEMTILAIREDGGLDSAMPSWHDLLLTAKEILTLPERWRLALAQWRGIYYIFDASDGKAYVGSAYGTDNLYGRWYGYAKSGHGGNVLLKARDPQHFRFSILQLLLHDAMPDDVISIESSWKRRLHTRKPFGLNDN